MRPSILKFCVLAALAGLAGCGKKSTRRAEIVECSSISMDAKGTTQCLVGLYHWRVPDATKAANARAHELDSIKTFQADSVWAAGAVKHRRDLGNCAKSDDQVRSCLLVAGWPLSRVLSAQDSVWNHNHATHARELQTCAAKREMNLSSCLTLYYKWDSDRAIATADSVARARLGGTPQRR